MCIDEKRFEHAKNKVIGINRERQGIGTLSEKTVHAVLKNYYAPDTDMHEIPIENFVADIYTGSEIIEIQTRAFNNMRKKANSLFARVLVTIVYPIPTLSGFLGSTRRLERPPRSGSLRRRAILIRHLLSYTRYALF